jgi:hypothetical protein
MMEPLRMLQLNISRSRARMEALINDAKTQHLDILLIQEPLALWNHTQVHHREWHCPNDGLRLI